MASDEIVKLIIDGENLLSDDINDAVKDLEKLSKESKQTANELKDLRVVKETASDFERLQGSIDKTEKELIQAKTALKEVKKEVKDAGDSVSRDLNSKLSQAEVEVTKLNASLRKQTTAFDKTQASLTKYGVDIKDISQESLRLAGSIENVEAKQKSINAQYQKSRQEIAKNVAQVKAEKAEQLSLIQTLDLSEKQREELTTIVERQVLASRRVSDLVDEENVSRKKILSVIKNESDARKRNVVAFEALNEAAKKQAAQLAKSEQSIKDYAKEFDLLVRQQERGELSTREFIEAEKKLISSLDLTKSKVAEARAEIRAIAVEEERAAQTKKATLAQQEALTKSIGTYRVQLTQLNKAQLDGTLNAEQYTRKVEELRKELKLSKAEVNDLTRAIEKDNKALAAGDANFDKRIQKEKALNQETKKLNGTLKLYQDQLIKLNAAKKKGKIDTDQYAAAELALRQKLKLTEEQVKATRQQYDLLEKQKAKASRSTDALTKVTRRLAQAYTVLLAAQKATESVYSNVKQYGDLEAAITKVEKTTNLARQEVLGMADELQRLATDITPTATNELLRMSEVAGQLGASSTEDIMNMVVAADALGNSTNLAGDEAVTLLARILAMTNEGLPSIHNLSSSVVDLGNQFAASEDEIVHMTKELVTGTRAIDLGSAAAAGFGATLRELGQPAERSRSAIQRIAQTINEASLRGGEDLEKLSKITGLTADEIEKNLGDKPEEVLIRFIEGLENLNQAGESVSSSLSGFGITAQDTVSVVSTLAKNTDRLREGVDLSSKAYIEANKHLEEAAKAYANQESSIGRLVNKFTELQTVIGESFSDETNATVESLGAAIEKAEIPVIHFFDAIGELTELLADMFNVIVNLGDIVPVFDQLGTAFETIQILGRSAITVFNGIALGINEIKISVAEFFGASEEALEGYRKKSAEIVADINKNIEKQTDLFGRLAGESSGVYDDLRDAVNDNKAAFDNLDESVKKQIENALVYGNYTEENTKQYAEWTAEIIRNKREIELAEALKAKQAKAEADRAEKARKSALARIATEDQVNALITSTAQSTQELAEKEALLTLARDEGKLSAANYFLAMQLLVEEKRELREASKEELEATIKSIEANKDYSKAVKDVRIEIAEYERSLKDIDIKLRSTINGTQEINELTLEKIDLTEKLNNAQKELTLTQELEGKTQSELLSIAEAHALKLELLSNQYTSGSITLGEYNKAKLALATTSKVLNNLLPEETRQLLEAANAADRAANSYKNLKQSKDGTTESDKDSNEQLEKNNELLAKNAGHAGVSAAYAARWQRLQDELNQELDYSSKTVDELNKELSDLNSEMGEFELATAKATHDLIGIMKPLDDVTRQIQRKKQATLEETISLNKMIKSAQSGTLSLEQLGSMAFRADQYFTHLSDNQLDKLRDAISSARQEFAQLSDEINDTYDDLQDRLDDLNGNQENILDRQYKREVEELQDLLQRAKQSNDQDLVSKVEAALRNLRKAHEIETKNLRRELEDAKKQNDTTTNTTNSAFGDGQHNSATHIIELKLPNAVSTKIKVGSQNDADALISALESLGNINIDGNN